jgi:hypothetical protein
MYNPIKIQATPGSTRRKPTFLRHSKHGPDTKLIWTREDQTKVALLHGFLIVKADKSDLDEDGKPLMKQWATKRDGARIHPLLGPSHKRTIYTLIAKGVTEGNPLMLKARDFMKQQHEHGYVGSWERGIDGPSTLWLKAGRRACRQGHQRGWRYGVQRPRSPS